MKTRLESKFVLTALLKASHCHISSFACQDSCPQSGLAPESPFRSETPHTVVHIQFQQSTSQNNVASSSCLPGIAHVAGATASSVPRFPKTGLPLSFQLPHWHGSLSDLQPWAVPSHRHAANAQREAAVASQGCSQTKEEQRERDGLLLCRGTDIWLSAFACGRCPAPCPEPLPIPPRPINHAPNTPVPGEELLALLKPAA